MPHEHWCKYFKQNFSKSYPTIFLKTSFIYFLERGREREREGEKKCMVASRMPPTGDLAHNPGMCPRLGIEPVTL